MPLLFLYGSICTQLLWVSPDDCFFTRTREERIDIVKNDFLMLFWFVFYFYAFIQKYAKK